MMKIILTQIAFLIGNVILITFLDFELKAVIANHLVLSLGYFSRYIQEYMEKQE